MIRNGEQFNCNYFFFILPTDATLKITSYERGLVVRQKQYILQ
ncbi:hypothetical protein LEP1GSC133_1655 [Leptospira borgpetersenii serovar Pomona str. 200901868]|uniref:Uncharacterized protein n=1 Tax=Leptospira borgpetersenii serovar Pomona str. 200901868 TaxID=1192866 RepID=M6WLM2_LEPBO|nr:hypothetical protein LEP1GSC133_1655 [Leptospira borgpetersenii serovar Pomona str. 200901868]